MKISTKGRYAVRLVLDIAAHSGEGNVSLKDVAKRQEISLKYLEQIVTLLCRGRVLKAQRGSKGGYRLFDSPDKFTVGDILRVTEGSLAPVSCLETDQNVCSKRGFCQTLPFWEGLYKTINDYMDSVTIRDILNNPQATGEDMSCYI